MNVTTLNRPMRQARREAASHLFTVGQIVRLRGHVAVSSAADMYRITGTLPPRGNSPQYRIRNEDERYERVATQDTLEPVRASPSGDFGVPLVERTFGPGQGAETQQSRNQEPEAEQDAAQG